MHRVPYFISVGYDGSDPASPSCSYSCRPPFPGQTTCRPPSDGRGSSSSAWPLGLCWCVCETVLTLLMVCPRPVQTMQVIKWRKVCDPRLVKAMWPLLRCMQTLRGSRECLRHCWLFSNMELGRRMCWMLTGKFSSQRSMFSWLGAWWRSPLEFAKFGEGLCSLSVIRTRPACCRLVRSIFKCAGLQVCT